MALLDIVDNEKLFSDGVKLLIRSRLSSAIANTPGYESYDRVDIASIMDEQQFQRTGLVDDSQIKRLGEMTGADYILVTEAAEFDDSHIVMIAKILNVESARLERISDVTTTTDIDMLEKSCRELIGKLLTVRQELKIGENLYVGESKGGIPDGEGLMRFSEDDPEGRVTKEAGSTGNAMAKEPWPTPEGSISGISTPEQEAVSEYSAIRTAADMKAIG